METAALVAPITALEFLKAKYVLTGEGPILTVYSLQPRPKASASLSVLKHYRIHGIRPRPAAAGPRWSSATETCWEKEDEWSSTSEPNHYDLVVFGGKAVRLVRLLVELHGGDHLHLEALGPLMELQDWALDVRWLSGEGRPLLGVALAHNSALLLDVHEGKALVQSSCLEGCLLYSALLLVDESWGDSVLVGGTVFNQLVVWKPGGEGNEPEHKAPVERRLLGHSGVIFSISYLQEKGWLASASDDRSVRLWGVGVLGGPGGKCGDLNPACLMALYGHQARVFSVHLSAGKVFSAGEDGACLVWDWAGGGKVARTLKGHRAGGVRALAVSDGKGGDGIQERWVATGGADGGVRLWTVEESEEGEERKGEAATETLTDLKFAGEGMPKVLCVLGGASRWTQSKVVVCTDQGIVYQYCNRQWELVWQGGPEFQSYCVMEMLTVRVKDSPSKAHLCAVGNLNGGIQVFPLSQPQSGLLLSGGSGKIHSLIWLKGQESNRQGVYLLASGAEGLVHRWCIGVKMDEDSSLVLKVDPLPPFVLPPCAKRWLTATVRLHPGPQGVLWVCGDRRGSLLLFQEGRKRRRKEAEEEIDEDLMIGSAEVGREGEENGMDKEERKRGAFEELPLQPVSCLFGVHGKQGVTSVCEYQGLLYSAGRDGCVRVFRTRPTRLETPGENRGTGSGRMVGTDEGLQLEVLRVQRACRGMEWLERVLILEPEHPEQHEEEEGIQTKQENAVVSPRKGGEEKRENQGREVRFVIAGFHGVHFVVWDPVRHERLLAVPCGGGHRSWSLWPSHKGSWPGYGALVFIKQGVILASQPPGETPVWARRAGKSGGWGLREGVHGKGVGCVCRLGRIRGTGDVAGIEAGEQIEEERKEGHWEILATGGEDTSLTVLAVQPDTGVIKVLSVITDHISSVRTLAAAMRLMGGSDSRGRTDKQSLSALLVSAGGRAQMQCYRLLISWDGQRQVPSCQVIQVASHRLDEQWERRRNRHKTVKMDPETRYMSIAVVDEEADGVLLALACSDGAVRLFSVSEVKGHIDLLWESFYHQRCVLSVATYSLEDGKGNRYKLLLSAATDGKIAVWDVTAASSLSTSRLSDAPTPPIPCLSIPAHQSGVNSLAVWAEKAGRQQGGCLVTVASGGDDGQLTVTVVQVQYPEQATEGSRGFSQHREQISERQTKPHICPQFPLQPHPQLPDSLFHLHLQLHSQSCIPLAHAAPLTALGLLSPGLLVSTSPDQRLCQWRVCSTGISHSGALYSHVADAAGLAVWEEGIMDEGKGEGEIGGEDGREGDGKGEVGFGSGSGAERETAPGGGRDSETGVEAGGKTTGETEGETGGAFGKTECETVGEEPVEAMSETGDTICDTRDEKGGETAGETTSEVSSETGCEPRVKTDRVGWVLVCGQGLQLLRVRKTAMDGGKREEEEERVKVTFQENTT